MTCRIHAAVADGYVVKIDSPTIYLDWGQTSGLSVGDRFTVYRPGGELRHPVTGEVLGHAEKAVGSGMIESIQDKFSTGRLIEDHGIQVGDRSRWNEASPPPAPAPGASAAPTRSTLPEIWRSKPIDGQGVAVVIADLSGDGKKELVLATQHRLDVFRWNGQALEPVAQATSGGQAEWLAVEAADVDHLGHDRLFATSYLNAIHRPRVEVFEWADGKLKEVAHLAGFARLVDHADGIKTLLWQNVAFTSEPKFSAPAPLLPVKGGYKEGPSMSVPNLKDSPLFGYTFGDWDGDGAEDMAVLENGDHIRIFFKDAKWSSPDVSGGTKVNFFLDQDKFVSFPPRLMRWRSADGHDLLVVPHNLPEMGLQLTYLKIFSGSELEAWAWDGQRMSPVWKLGINAYLPDYAMGDVTGAGTPQLWTAQVGASSKTVLAAYRLP
ncbi:MAG TPA: FG-GAP-like repeat-containing protein [Elusimicrobiota bacterium]|nr:FG-GAP-like repeat-containing protein [Elusimicrobiota bacterium]